MPGTLPLAWEDAGNFGGVRSYVLLELGCIYGGMNNPFGGYAWMIGTDQHFDYDEIYQDIPVTVGEGYSVLADLAVGGRTFSTGVPVAPECRGRLAVDYMGTTEWDITESRTMTEPGISIFAVIAGPFIAQKSPIRISLYGQSPVTDYYDLAGVLFDNVEIVRHAAGESTEVRNWELYR